MAPFSSAPVCNQGAADCDTQSIIRAWYTRLQFPAEFDAEFEAALSAYTVPADATVENYDVKEEDGKKNLLHFLYFCEETKRRYTALGLPEEILLATLADIVVYTKHWSGIKGTLVLFELPWLMRHLTARIFRLGRLQFCAGKSECDIPEIGVKRDDPILEVHIPEGEKLSTEACLAAFDAARDFFARYYPGLTYACFTCHSWLLDETLRKYLSEGSNILRFGDLFTRLFADKSDALLHYIFRWDTTEKNLSDFTPTNAFAARIKAAVEAGEEFHETYGWRA